MWTEGSIKVNETVFHFWVKHYSEPSEIYGLNGGKISKVSLKANGEWTADYDRGWNIRPKTAEAETALAILMKDYN